MPEMSQLAKKILLARQRQVTVNRRTFTIQRPTPADLASMTREDPLAYVRRFVVGWDLKGVDLYPGGGPELEAFDPEAWALYVEDRMDLWDPLGEEILKFYQEVHQRREEDAKN